MRQGACGGTAEKPLRPVILSVAKDLALRFFMAMRDSSSPAAPQNDSLDKFFRSLFSPAEIAASALCSSRAPRGGLRQSGM
jgi:hypothetical protein